MFLGVVLDFFFVSIDFLEFFFLVGDGVFWSGSSMVDIFMSFLLKGSFS